ncbi:MAG: 3-deoxy-manno-octulosonate cytidylyltransferase [Candidatus Omnitrophota bacterium]|nr:3-deoxy-manno-octulosonate cytidylyltransferase [Candidatus Omnitrophota bacterium]
MKIIAMIPARMGSYRFPGKPLCDIKGMTMIEHVYRRTAMCPLIDETYMVTCNKEIEEETKKFGGRVIMTPDTFNRCTDRIAYAVRENNMDVDIVVLVQGDEPLVYPEMITDITQALINDETAVAGCLYSKIKTDEEYEDPNEIKVVKTLDDYALYFSRDPIPSKKLSMKPYDRYKQVCIMPYRKDFLLKFTEMEQTPLEIVESVDMLRIIENGYKLKVKETKYETCSVDVPVDRDRAERLMERDPLFPKYKRSH